jgi:hypothetical protein
VDSVAATVGNRFCAHVGTCCGVVVAEHCQDNVNVAVCVLVMRVRGVSLWRCVNARQDRL